MQKKSRDLLIAGIILVLIVGAIFFSRMYSDSLQPSLPQGSPSLKDSTSSQKQTERQETETSQELPFGAIQLSDFSGKKLADGTTFDPKNYENKVVVANFWATWCHYCVAEMPHFQKVYDKYKDDDRVAFVLANLTGAGGDTEAKVKSFMEENKYTMPVLFDENVEVFRKLGVRGTPVTAFIGHNGQALQVSNFNGHSLYYHMGLIDENTLEAYIKSALELREESMKPNSSDSAENGAGSQS